MDAATHKLRVGERLKVAIEALGISQADFARSIGISASKLGNWIRGDNYPSHLQMAQIILRWNITADWLLVGRIAGVASPLADELWTRASALSEGYSAQPGQALGTVGKKVKAKAAT